MRMNIEGYIRIGISEQAQRIGDKSTTTLPAPLESKKGRKWTQNESFYPILLVGMNIFCIFAKVMTVTVITNTILDMKFYDRGNERQVLGEVLQQSRSEARMTVLMGRRRIGKTELSQRCGDDTVLYFFVGKKAEALLCQDYVREIREKPGCTDSWYTNLLLRSIQVCTPVV